MPAYEFHSSSPKLSFSLSFVNPCYRRFLIPYSEQNVLIFCTIFIEFYMDLDNKQFIESRFLIFWIIYIIQTSIETEIKNNTI